ncbi:fungal-specific transcription factor domain-containing protein [Dendryphion nanum]|uniref:Fungal-specific transcription factor domain-containing protein n=1 Tax=Dendryphion nanum TaxID=256645 RepID=A0A9P9IM47_9PLEO|nr:fungal-specific transcription factor domain-containing protein [Dendryphion nanum]
MHIHNEIGTLRAHPNGESVFVGSSSGVFFINTVRRAFAQAAANSRRNQISRNEGDASSTFANLPSPEDCIIGTETRSSQLSSNGRTMTTESTETTQNTDASWTRSALNDFGELPTHAIAKELLVTYFQTWHPLFPFLHGPTCLKDIEEIYVTGGGKKPKSLSTAIIFQCLFNIAKLDTPDLILSEKPQGHSVEQLMLALGAVSLRSDLASLQALLAAQLYLVAIMDFRSASTVGGMVIRSMFKSGLHRCPVRYTNLKTDDRDIRKRIFWSAYCLDRYVCQTLGHPLGYQDSDFDVCEPGELDLHEPVPTSNKADLGTSPEETVLHLPANHPSRTHISLHQDQSSPEAGQTGSHFRHNNQERGPAAGSVTADVEHVSRQRRDNQTAQPQFVKCSQLTGRMMELFHKSIHARSADRQHVLFLKADIDAWGNDLPSYPCHSETDSTDLTSLNRDVFLRVAQQQLLLLVNRPSLSLNPASAEFNHAAQICIGAARSIIRLLESHLNSGGSIFWPGSMNAVWMGGLVMAFTCQLKLQQVSRSVCDIISSLKVLKVMKKRWRMAQNCEAVLEMLLDSIQNPEPPIIGTPALSPWKTATKVRCLRRELRGK